MHELVAERDGANDSRRCSNVQVIWRFSAQAQILCDPSEGAHTSNAMCSPASSADSLDEHDKND